MPARKLTWTQKAKIAWSVLFHRETPISAKATIVGALLYGILPIDLIPDILPILGMMDDAFVVLIAILAFLHFTKDIRKAMEQDHDVIDVQPL